MLLVFIVSYRIAKCIREITRGSVLYGFLTTKELIFDRMNTLFNMYIIQFLLQLCDGYGVRLVAPEPKYCTDNGLMIAWNGLEKWRKNLDIVRPEDVFGPRMKIDPRASFGTDISEKVHQANIKMTWHKIN